MLSKTKQKRKEPLMPNFIKIDTELKGFINTNTRKVGTISDTDVTR